MVQRSLLYHTFSVQSFRMPQVILHQAQSRYTTAHVTTTVGSSYKRAQAVKGIFNILSSAPEIVLAAQ